MNNARRKILSVAIESLQSVYDVVDNVLSEEQTSLENIPENLEGSERYNKTEESIDGIEEALDSISSAVEELESVIS